MVVCVLCVVTRSQKQLDSLVSMYTAHAHSAAAALAASSDDEDDDESDDGQKQNTKE